MANWKENDVYNGQSRQVFWSDAVFASCKQGLSRLAELGIAHGSMSNLAEI